MSKVVLMCGISGSGKTTRAQQLVEKGFIKLSVDESIWHRFGIDAYQALSPEEKMQATLSVENALLSEMQSLIMANKDVVIDSTMCKRAKRDMFKSFAENLGAEVSLFYIHTDKETLRKRLQDRKGNYGPNTFPVSRDELDRFWGGFEHPTTEELATYTDFDLANI